MIFCLNIVERNIGLDKLLREKVSAILSKQTGWTKEDAEILKKSSLKKPGNGSFESVMLENYGVLMDGVNS